MMVFMVTVSDIALTVDTPDLEICYFLLYVNCLQTAMTVSGQIGYKNVYCLLYI
jgi:hypothetical protein